MHLVRYVPMKRLNTLCAILVEGAMFAVVVLVALSLFSAFHTRHLTVVQTIDSEHALLTGDTAGVRVGEHIPLYRFNPDWKLPIGEATVVRTTPSGVEVSIDEGEMRWPLGRQGTLERAKNGEWIAQVGTLMGFKEADTLKVFRGRTLVGQATITSISKETATVELSGDIANTSGLAVSEYRFATQGAWQPRWALFFEGFLVALFLCAYALWYFFARRSPLKAFGDYVRTLPVSPSVFFWPIHIIAVVPFAWFMAKMPLYLLVYLVEFISSRLGDVIRLRSFADSIFPFVFVLLVVISYGFLLWRRTSPILALWRFLSYKRPSAIQKVSWKRGLVLWTLHLAIVYVFGWTLIRFLIGDIAAAQAIGPHPRSLQELADFWKYVIWALTVVGVLFGYGYSVVSILWGRFIRNLDFTITGWLTNGFCYPFLGVVIWQMVPSFTGLDPIISGSPLALFALILGSLLNLLYMLSIWNLGTMFDLMTDKGVRTSLFYSTIRHPNYTLEVLMFFVTELVGLSSGMAWLGISVYFFLYWIRSEREDNFMWYSNPKYSEYQKQTPYKFIPGIY